jgi:hypothetical protein
MPAAPPDMPHYPGKPAPKQLCLIDTDVLDVYSSRS